MLIAAEKVFAAQGTSATLNDVANAADVGPATSYRRFGNKETLVREVLNGFFGRLVELANEADQASPELCVDVFLETVGYELADKAGLTSYVWGDLAPRSLVDELRRRVAELLARAQKAGAMRADLTSADITATVWALRGVVQGGRAGSTQLDDAAWRRHLAHVLDSFHDV